MKPFFYISTCFFILTFFSCEENSGVTKRTPCIIPDLEWLSVDENYDQQFLNQFRGEIAAIASTSNLITTLQGQASIEAQISDVFHNLGQRKLKVSEDFFEKYKAVRAGLCGYLALLDRPNISQESKREIELLIIEQLSVLGDIRSTTPQNTINALAYARQKLENKRDDLRNAIHANKSSSRSNQGKMLYLENLKIILNSMEDAMRRFEKDVYTNEELINRVDTLVAEFDSTISKL